MTTFNFGDVGNLSKPADTLIKKVAHAVGVWWEPKQMVRIAEAQAKVDMIQAIAKIERDELAERTAKRFVYEELRKQDNMESIIGKAIPDVSDRARPESVEDDWIANFFDKCRLISDEQMQRLWAKILAGEANSPGRFSKKTVNLVANLDKSDAEAFTRLCGFAVSLGNCYPLVYDEKQAIYTDNGISLYVLTNLESIGLIRFDTLAGFVQGRIGPKIPVVYYSEKMFLELPQKENPTFKLGRVILTEPGMQLASVCDAHPVAGFIDYLKGKWKEFGYKVEP